MIMQYLIVQQFYIHKEIGIQSVAILFCYFTINQLTFRLFSGKFYILQFIVERFAYEWLDERNEEKDETK